MRERETIYVYKIFVWLYKNGKKYKYTLYILRMHLSYKIFIVKIEIHVQS